jgi:hypothetical protein
MAKTSSTLTAGERTLRFVMPLVALSQQSRSGK